MTDWFSLVIDHVDYNKLCKSRSFFRYQSKYSRLRIKRREIRQ